MTDRDDAGLTPAVVPQHRACGSDDSVKLQFSDREIVELTWTIATINTWNRMAIGLRAPVVEKPIE